jgi:RimJ/RimL family protein N-acetyltransferase
MFPELARDDVFRLETRRLWLRWPRESDAPAIAALAGDWEVARLTAMIPHPYECDDAGRFILAARAGNALGSALRFALTLKTFPRKMVGVVGIEASDHGPLLVFWLGKPYWGAGLMSEAVEALTDVFFQVTHGDALAAVLPPENAASRGMLEKVGFVEAEGLDAGIGRYADSPVVRFALSRRDWQSLARPGLQAAFASDRALS